jgi:hypothetical protein
MPAPCLDNIALPLMRSTPADAAFSATSNRTGDIPSHGSATSSLHPASRPTMRVSNLTPWKTFETNGRPAILSPLSSTLSRLAPGECTSIRQTSSLSTRGSSTKRSRRFGWLARSISTVRIRRTLWGGFMGELRLPTAILTGASTCRLCILLDQDSGWC